MRIVGYALGGLLVLIGLPPLILGVGMAVWLGDGSGLDIPLRGFTAPPKAIAIVSPELGVKAEDLPSQLADASIDLRIVPPAGSPPLFIGVADASAVKRYLRRVPIATIEPVDAQGQPLGGDGNGNGSGKGNGGGSGSGPDPQAIVTDGLRVRLVLEPGRRAKVALPAKQAFWISTIRPDANGVVRLTVGELSGRNVRVVVMREDAKPGIAADAAVQLHVPILRSAGLIVLLVGVVIVGLGALIIVLIARGGRRRAAAAAMTPVDDAAAPADDAADAAANAVVAEPGAAEPTPPEPAAAPPDEAPAADDRTP